VPYTLLIVIENDKRTTVKNIFCLNKKKSQILVLDHYYTLTNISSRQIWQVFLNYI
jgi:hypothetical protein